MNPKLGKTIKILRQAKELKVGDLAKRASISPSLLSLIESGGRQPSIDVLRRIADALDVPSEAILLISFKSLESSNKKAEEIANGIEQMISVEERLKDILRNKDGAHGSKRHTS